VFFLGRINTPNNTPLSKSPCSQKDEEDEEKLAKLLRPPKPNAPKHVWKCVDCEEMLPSRSKLKKHRQTCEVIGTPMSKKKKRTDEAPIPCEYCGKMLSCKMGYKQHLKYCIGIDKSEVEGKALDEPIEKKTDSDDGEDDRVVCHICGKKILHRSTLAGG
jgi:ribosomal protein S27E